MDDQFNFLTSVGIKALNLTSAFEEQKTKAEMEKYSLVYGSPEAWLKTSAGDRCCTTMCTPVSSVPLQSIKHRF